MIGSILKFLGDIFYKLEWDAAAEACYSRARKRGAKMEWGGDRGGKGKREKP